MLYTGIECLVVYPEDEITCSVLDVPWAATFSASFSRKIQLYQREKPQPHI